MIISVNWLKKYTDIDVSVDELAELIGSRLVEIEEVIDLGAKYKDVVIARVAECEKLEGSDHLNVTKLDDKGVVPGLDRDENGYVQVVCGAPNIRAGLMVAWLPPKSTVPSTYGDAEPFVLGSRKLMGVMSNGMVASAAELGLYDDHKGILELDELALAGESFAKTYELDDYLLDIENKSLTHRPDCFGIIGFAREVSAIQGKPFRTPNWLADTDAVLDVRKAAPAPNVAIDDVSMSQRYQAVLLSGADGNSMSPMQVQTYLARVGLRPISAVVDATNYLMLLTGQPLHAFDYDKVKTVSGSDSPTIHVRGGREGETLELLDGRTITLTPADIVIAAGDVAIGLAGAMGGSSTEIDETTQNIILESASFNLFNLRTTQMRHGIFSEAITRFTKGQAPLLTQPALNACVDLICHWSGASVSSEVADCYPNPKVTTAITIDTETVDRILGTADSPTQIRATLENVEFDVSVVEDRGEGAIFEVTAPYWRGDIHILQDIVEEIGRINAYDDIDPDLPSRQFVAIRPNGLEALKGALRGALVRSGANEVLTYSFIHGDVLSNSGQDSNNSFRITNSISPDLQYYRQSLTPSLLGLVHPNIKSGYDKFGIFEINKIHRKSFGMTDEGVPVEGQYLGAVFANKDRTLQSSFYEAKAYLQFVSDQIGVNLDYKKLGDSSDNVLTSVFEVRRSAEVVDSLTGQSVGVIGEYKKSVSRSFKLPESIAGFEIDIEKLYSLVSKAAIDYMPLSKYPSTSRDICFRVDRDEDYARVVSVLSTSLKTHRLQTSVSPVDIYADSDSQTKNITVRIKFTPYDKTLESAEVNKIVASASSAVVQQIGAQIV